MNKLYVGVSGLNAADNPGPGIGVARSLKEDPESDVVIVGLAYDAMEPGNYMDWVVDKAYTLPYPSGNGAAYLARLLHIKRTFGLDLVIPNLDAELPVYIRCADELQRHGIATFLPSMRQFRLRGKDRLAEIAETIGTELPRTAVVTSEEMLYQAVQRIGLPVMVKGIYYEAHRAYTVQEAMVHFRQVAAKWGYPVVVQEMIVGDELNVVGLGDGHGEAMGLLGMKKVAVTTLGKVWSGVTVQNPELLAAAELFVREYRWRGPFELECIVRDDYIHLIEINPRFPAWTYFATGVGVNLPSRLVRCCRGMPADPPPDYSAGKMLVRYSYEFVADMKPFRTLVTVGETP